MMIGRVPMLLIVHEYTLFTIVRRKSTFQNLESITADILKSCPWYYGSKSLSHGAIKLGDVVDKRVENVGTLQFVYFRDPEGNIVEIQSWK